MPPLPRSASIQSTDPTRLQTSSPSGSSSTSKRKQSSDRDLNDSDDNGHLANGRKKRTISPTPWNAWGKDVTRLIDPFSSVSLCVFNYLRVTDGQIALSKLKEINKQAYESYHLIKDHNEAFHQIVVESPDYKDDMIREMKLGQNQARDTDTHALKGLIIEMVRFLYPNESADLSGLEANLKVNRGFRNPVFGRLLCPWNKDWDNAETREELATTPAGVSTYEWPVFFYPHGQLDREYLAQGFLRGELLVFAYRAIYLGPSKWSRKSTRISAICNARKHEMTSVTPRSIAYIASQVRAALSSESTNPKCGGTFSADTFYWKIVEFLETPFFKEEVEELVEWWNEEIFPAPEPDWTEPEEDSLEIMKKQVEQKRAALASRTNDAEV